MNEMRKLIEAVESAQSGRRAYDVEYTVTVNVPVDAADQDEVEDKFFDYLFSNELQMDHNFGLDLGEVTITPQLAGNQMDEQAEQGVTEGSAHGYNVARWYEKNNDQVKLTKWLRKEAGLPKDAPVYFDDADLVYGDKTIVPDALVDPKLKFNDLLTALVTVTGGTPKQYKDGIFREQGAQKGGITFEDLINGKVGRVRAEEPGEEEDEEDVFVIDGHKYGIVKSVASDVVNFVNKHIDADQSNLILFKEYGYRGYFAYYGAIHVKGKWYGLDIMSEDDVFLLQKEPPGRTTPKYAMPF